MVEPCAGRKELLVGMVGEVHENCSGQLRLNHVVYRVIAEIAPAVPAEIRDYWARCPLGTSNPSMTACDIAAG
jgi:hypothetical protein